jgi:hypothetical protein
VAFFGLADFLHCGDQKQLEKNIFSVNWKKMAKL